MKIFHSFLLFFVLLSFVETKGLEIKILATVNNKVISDYDLFIEIKLQELLNNRDINKSQYRQILQLMIDETIKESEVKKNNITADKKAVNAKINEILSQFSDETKLDDQIKSNIKSKIENSIKWNNLILTKFKNKIAINTNEIDQIIKSKDLNEQEKDKITILEKNKKLQVFSKTYFNEVKKKYFVKIY
jgi:ATP-dependent Lon protease